MNSWNAMTYEGRDNVAAGRPPGGHAILRAGQPERGMGTADSVGPEGLSYEPGDISDLPTVIEFDPASFVLTAYGRYNAGTVRGDTAAAERFLSLFIRI